MIPNNAYQISRNDIRVYVQADDTIVITATPHTDDEAHNCDWMGCGWEHVIIRAKIEQICPSAKGEKNER